MAIRAPLIAVALVLLAGCADDDSGPGGGSDMSAGGFDMGAGCAVVEVTADSPTAPAMLTATARVTGGLDPSWTVMRAGDPTLPLTGNTLTVSYEATQPGTYTFFVRFASGHPCPGSGSITLQSPTAASTRYRLRALPPETAMLPLTDSVLVLYGGVPLSGVNLALESGTMVTGTLRGPSGAERGEVRLIADSGPDAVTTTAPDGAFALAVRNDGFYTPLLVPESALLAPHLGARMQGIDLVGTALVVGAGEPVAGSITDGTSSPIAGVHVALRAGALPSGLGTSGSDGAFALRAEAGSSYTLAFGSDTWPQASVAGVAVPAGGASFAIQYTVTRHPVAATIFATDGTTPVGGAQVTILSDPIDPVASVTIGGATRSASGTVVQVVATAADGTITPPLQLPDGGYDVFVEPPPGTAGGLTRFRETVAGGATWPLTLQPRISLTACVTTRDGAPVKGAAVTAFEQTGLGAAPRSTSSGDDGCYAIDGVDPGARLQLLVEPKVSDKLSSRRVSLPAGTTRADVVLPPGLPVAGFVTRTMAGGGGVGLRDVRVQALCWSCGSPTPLAEAISGDNGAFTLYLPDPGDVVIVDGGGRD